MLTILTFHFLYLESFKLQYNFSQIPFQVLCPRCDVGSPGVKRKMRRIKEQTGSAGKKKYPKPDGLLELEKALNESKDTATAVSDILSPCMVYVCMYV